VSFIGLDQQAGKEPKNQYQRSREGAVDSRNEAHLSHENLNVYHKALAFLERTEQFLASWDSRHAIADHLPRAAESVVINLAEGCRNASEGAKLKSLDVSIASSLECAGCLDIAREKSISPADIVFDGKRQLAEVACMLFSLRRSWLRSGVHEESPAYEFEQRNNQEPLFAHEKLHAYKVALEFAAWFNLDTICQKLTASLFGKLDRASTSLVLNIAEGNGRFAELDRSRFLNEANRAAIRAGAYLDVAVHRHALTADEITHGKSLLVRAAQMTAALGNLRNDR
jgi:four helix bundle protein